MRSRADATVVVLRSMSTCLILWMALSASAQTDSSRAKTSSPSHAGSPTSKSDKQNDLKRFDSMGYATHEHHVPVSGKAVDQQGRPVENAQVFVIPVNPHGVPFVDRGILAKGTTDKNGHYSLKDVPLYVLEFRPQAVPKPTEARFQVFAIAEGYGYVWREAHAFRPEQRPAADHNPQTPVDSGELRTVFYEGEPIAVDLHFEPEVRLHGLITDDSLAPLKGAVIQVGLVNTYRDRPGTPPRHWNCIYEPDCHRAADGQFYGVRHLPEEFRLARTDSDGFYEIRGLPRHVSMSGYMDYRPEFEPWSPMISIRLTPPATNGQHVDFQGELNHTFMTPVEVSVNVVGKDWGPLPNAIVRQESSKRLQRHGSMDRCDESGLATLRLMPGTSRLLVEPAIGQPFLPMAVDLDLKKNSGKVSIDVVLDPAAEVILEAIEKETGKPIAGIGFLSEADDSRTRDRVQSQLSFVDQPLTDQSGTLNAIFTPGARRFFVDLRRSNFEYEASSPISDSILLSTKSPTRIRFEFTKRKLAETDESLGLDLTEEMQPLAEVLRQQKSRYDQMKSVRFKVRIHNFLRAKMNSQQVKDMLDSLDSKETVDAALEALKDRFPDFNPSIAPTLITTDGVRRRVEESSERSGHDIVHVFNGEETIISMDSGRQLDIYDRQNQTMGFLQVSDFWNGPTPPRALATRLPQVNSQIQRTIRRRIGCWELETSFDNFQSRRITDEVTGFERLMEFGSAGQPIQEMRQYFPKSLPNQVAVPGLSIRVHYRGDALDRCEIAVIDQAELWNRLPPDTFLVSAPSGTNILDYRGIPREEMHTGRRAASGVISTAVPDVVAYRNKFAPTAPPVLKVGDQAPEFQVRMWLNASGKTEAPSITGKVVVIDYWGINCGPCLVQLAEVNAAAKHFEKSDLLVIGLHDASGKEAEVVEFASKKGLTFPIAIDNIDPKSKTFGATFAKFGIHGIPSAVVIDKAGKVAYIGEFKHAIEQAFRLTDSQQRQP